MRAFVVFFVLITIIFSIEAQNIDSQKVDLNEVVVFAGDNPANRIIKAAIQNRDINSPYRNNSFKCIHYHKFLFTTAPLNDSVVLSIQRKVADSLATMNDSMMLNAYQRLSNQHLFINESVTQHLFKQPDKEYKKVIASKTSGFSNPLFSIILTQIQSFSIYHNQYLEIMQAKYLSPLSNSGHNKYQFFIKDTIFQENDTTFVIQYYPKKGLTFNGLKGVLYINNLSFAVERFEATPYDTSKSMPIVVSHFYRKQSNDTWFPSQLKAQIVFQNQELDPFTLLILSSVKVSDIEINPELKNRDFGIVDVEDDINNNKDNDKLLLQYRDNELDERENKTYLMWDTLSKELKIEKRLFFLKTFTDGRLSMGPIDLDILELLDFNNMEGWRVGLGLYTNNRLSKYFNFGGYVAYGFKDTKLKWGVSSDITFDHRRDCVLQLSYISDVIESARTKFFDRQYTIFYGEFYRRWLLSKFDQTNRLKALYRMKITRFLSGFIQADYSRNSTCYNYAYLEPIADQSSFNSFSFTNFKMTVGFRLAFKEQYYKAEDFYFLDSSPYPIVMFHYTQGISGVFGSEFKYQKFDLKLTHKQHYKMLGFTEFSLFAGYTPSHLPYSLLYAPLAGYSMIGVDGKEQFAVMRANEFIASSYVHLFIRHNFGKMTQNKKFSPHIILCQNIGFGYLNNPSEHYGIAINTMEKGYFETGIVVEDLLVISKLLSFGVGTYYRYGHYSLNKTFDNFSFKIRFRVALN